MPTPASPPPLFTPDNVARDTPELLLKGLQDPTRENARAYFVWQKERFKHIQTFQAFLKEVAKEYK